MMLRSAIKKKKKYLSEQINEIKFGENNLALRLIKKNGREVIIKLTNEFSKDRFDNELSNQNLIRKIISIKENENAISIDIIEI